MTDARVVLVTAPEGEVPERLAHALVEEGLAACVNLVPGIRSIYRWQGAIEDDREVLLIVKTRTPLLDRLKDRLAALHPYDTPELLALPVDAGAEKYLAWLTAATPTD